MEYSFGLTGIYMVSFCVTFFFSFGWNSRKTLLIEKFKIILTWNGQFGVLFFHE